VALSLPIGLIKRDPQGFRLLTDGRPAIIVVESLSEETEDSDALQLVAAYWKKIGIKMLVKPQTLENFRLRTFSGNALMTAHAGVVTAVPKPATSPKEFAPTMQGGLQWPKWGMFVESKGKQGEKCDMESACKLLDYVKEWERATNDEDRRKAWDKILQTNADEVFSIGTVNGSPSWSGPRCATCPRRVTTPGIPADISGSTTPTRSGSRSSAGQGPTIVMQAPVWLSYERPSRIHFCSWQIYYCKSLSGYEARNFDSSAGFTRQGRFRPLCTTERTLRREPVHLTFATLSARLGPAITSAFAPLSGE
jgi:hypothetical protein